MVDLPIPYLRGGRPWARCGGDDGDKVLVFMDLAVWRERYTPTKEKKCTVTAVTDAARRAAKCDESLCWGPDHVGEADFPKEVTIGLRAQML